MAWGLGSHGWLLSPRLCHCVCISVDLFTVKCQSSSFSSYLLALNPTVWSVSSQCHSQRTVTVADKLNLPVRCCTLGCSPTGAAKLYLWMWSPRLYTYGNLSSFPFKCTKSRKSRDFLTCQKSLKYMTCLLSACAKREILITLHHVLKCLDVATVLQEWI